ncbi:MAG: M1 family metallopeptidase [Acidobacteria bacterium]|nr:M1 family metallopeptidase [Acidobacteriota bacterium]
MKFFAVFSILISLFLTPHVNGEQRSFNRDRTYDVQHYSIRLNFNRKQKSVSGDVVIRLKPLSGEFRTFALDAEDLQVQSVSLEASAKPLTFRLSKGKITIDLEKNYSPDEEIAVRLKYTAKPKKGIYFVDADIEKGRVVRAAQIWTQGESQETRYWLPSFDFPDDKATTEQFLTVNKGETVIGNGELVGQVQNPDGTITFHYSMPIPHSLYLTSFVIGKYLKVSDSYRGIPLGFYVYPDEKLLAQKAFGKTKDMFRIFEAVTGIDYPYNKYDQTMVAAFNFGGMENITATTMADTEIMMAKFKFGEGLVEDLVSHELSHSWFGNMVTCRNWAELWLNEGFATFMEAVYREKMYGRKDYIRKIRDDANEYFAYASGLQTSQHGLYNELADPDNDDTMFDPITYQKGGAVVHTLREELGDVVFWKAINKYLQENKFANVETKDLQAAMEEVSGRDLKWFFDQWVYAEGFPKIKVSQTYRTSSKTLELRFSQIHKADKDTPSAFILPLDVDIDVAAKTIHEKVRLANRDQLVSIKLDGKPSRITLDKDLKLPLKLLTISEIKVVP